MGNMKVTYVCSKGHETEGEHIPYGHVLECPTCHEISVKVYPQGGGREWVIIPEETARFHCLTYRTAQR
jgi:hypothetical protein